MQLLYCTSMGSHHYEQPNLKWHAENVHSFFTFPFCTCVQLLYSKSLGILQIWSDMLIHFCAPTNSSHYPPSYKCAFWKTHALLVALHLQIYMIWNAIFVWLHIKSEILIFKLSWYTFFYKCCFISALKINLTVWNLDLMFAANEGWRYLAFLCKLIRG